MHAVDTRSETRAVLLYHRIGWPRLSSLVAGQYVAPRLFESQMTYLLSRGWTPVSLSDVCDFSSLQGPNGGERFAVTFDDGYRSVYDLACPVLSSHGIPATVFVVVGSVDGINDWDRRIGDQEEQMMSSGQVRELANAGFEIGSHTISHPRLTELEHAQLVSELGDSRRRLEDLIGRAVVSLSYPYGDYDGRVLAAAAEAGYERAVTTRLGLVGTETAALEIPRVNVRWNAVGPVLMRKIGRARRTPATAGHMRGAE